MSANPIERPRTRNQLLALIAAYCGLNGEDQKVTDAMSEEYQKVTDEGLLAIVVTESRYAQDQADRLKAIAPFAEAAHTNWSSVLFIDEDGQLLAYANTPEGDVLLPWTVEEMLPEALWPSAKTARPSFRVYNTDHRAEKHIVWDEDSRSLMYYPINDRLSAVCYETYRSHEEYALALNEWHKQAEKNGWWKRVRKGERTPVDYKSLQTSIGRILKFVRGE